MRSILPIAALALSLAASAACAQPAAGPYKLLQTAKVGGDGGWDYVYADSAARRLYIARSGQGARVTVFDLDTLAPAGTIPGVSAHGAVVDPKSGHAFASSKPITMFDPKTLAPIKTIDVQGNPDGMVGDPAAGRVYILSHASPHVTAINAADGTVAGTVDVGGAPEQSASDGAGRLFVDVEDKDAVAVVDSKTLKLTGQYSLTGKCGTPAGLAMDVKNKILFVACRNPAVMAMVNADTGQVIQTLPIGAGVDGAVFNPATMEAFASTGGDGALTVIKENSPTSFAVEQTVQTHPGARTLTLDAKTGRVLVIAADFGPPPEAPPAPAGGPPARPRRGPMIPDSFAIYVVGK